jgi:hypothetical protein
MWDGREEYLIRKLCIGLGRNLNFKKLIIVCVAGAKTVFVAKLSWVLTSNLVRLSILCFFYRLVGHLQIRKHKWVLHCTTVFVVAGFLTYLCVIIFACL